MKKFWLASYPIGQLVPASCCGNRFGLPSPTRRPTDAILALSTRPSSIPTTATPRRPASHRRENSRSARPGQSPGGLHRPRRRTRSCRTAHFARPTRTTSRPRRSPRIKSGRRSQSDQRRSRGVRNPVAKRAGMVFPAEHPNGEVRRVGDAAGRDRRRGRGETRAGSHPITEGVPSFDELNAVNPRFFRAGSAAGGAKSSRRN